MGISKKSFIASVLLIFLNACHLVTSDDLSGANLAPDPDMVKTRTLVVLPLAIERVDKNHISDVARERFIWVQTQIQEQINNYLKFIDYVPGNLDHIIVNNEADIIQYYQQKEEQEAAEAEAKKQQEIEDKKSAKQKAQEAAEAEKQKELEEKDPSLKKETPPPPPVKKKVLTLKERKEMIEKTLKDNQKHWLTVTPENKQDILRKYKIPDRIALEIIQGKEKKETYIKQNYLVAQAVIKNRNEFVFNIYDPLSKTNMVLWKSKLPFFSIEKGDEKKLNAFMKSHMKKIIELMTQKSILEVAIHKKEPTTSIYIDSHLVLTPTVFLTKGRHIIFIANATRIVKRGSIIILKDGKIDIDVDEIEDHTFPVKIKTTPSHAALFVNEEYVGLSPMTIHLPSGMSYLRVSSEGRNHGNYSVTVSKEAPLKKLEFDLDKIDEAYLDKAKLAKDIKVASFFSSLGFLATGIYAIEREGYYAEFAASGPQPDLAFNRYNEFGVLSTTAFSIGGALLVTAIISQIFEYEFADLGVGIDQDKKLGLKVTF